MKNGISRRSFIAGTGAAIGGFAAGSLVGYTQPASAASAGAWPVPATITKANVMTNAFNNYWNGGGCCYGAAAGIIDTIRNLGDGNYDVAWDDVPTDMFNFGAGGGFGNWGTLCGALNGALWVMQQAIGSSSYFGKAVDTLIEWYINEPFPNVADGDIAAILNAKNSDTPYGVKDPVTAKTVYYDLSVAQITGGTTGDVATSVSNSPLCHVSVSTFLGAQEFGGKLQLWVPIVQSNDTTKVSDAGTRTQIMTINAAPAGESKGPRVGGIEKKVRCATLTAQTAWKAAQLIMDVQAASYGGVTGWVYAGDPADDCIQCHTYRSDGPVVEDNEQGKMPCEVCHDGRTDDQADYKAAVKNTVEKCTR